jgi:nitrogen regulatory protein P-II 1
LLPVDNLRAENPGPGGRKNVKKIEAIIRPERLEQVKEALAEAGFIGLNVTNVTGRGSQRGVVHSGRGGETTVIDMLPKLKLEVVVGDADADKAIDAILHGARTGSIGDGKIFVTSVEEVVRVRTGERGAAAL